TAYSDGASCQIRIRNEAAIGNDGLSEGGPVDFAGRQETRMGIDRGLRFEEAVFRHDVGEVEVRLVKGANRSDVLPVAFEDERANVPIFDRHWDNVFAEIDQVVLQRFYEHVSVEDINPHRRLT